MTANKIDLDIHGRLTISGVTELISTKRANQLMANRALAPKAKNGLTDPFTYYHIVDMILDVNPGSLFTAADLTDALNEERPMCFDSITVGRIIMDIAESLEDANRSEPIQVTRAWDGRHYLTTDRIEDRVALEKLLEDLEKLCLKPERSTQSPMYRCPSVRVVTQ